MLKLIRTRRTIWIVNIMDPSNHDLVNGSFLTIIKVYVSSEDRTFVSSLSVLLSVSLYVNNLNPTIPMEIYAWLSSIEGIEIDASGMQVDKYYRFN